MIAFDEEKHLYTERGEVVPSVTFVLRQTGVSPDPRFYTRKARERGKAVHEAIRLLDEGRLDWGTVDEEIQGWIAAYGAWLTGDGSRFVRAKNEVVLWDPVRRVAGKADKVAWDALFRARAVVEFKTGDPDPSHELQVQAYMSMVPTERGKPSARGCLVYLRKNGTYAQKPVDISPVEWHGVVATFNLARARHLKWLQKIKEEEALG